MTIQEFIDKNKIEMTAELVDSNPHHSDLVDDKWTRDASHYEVSFSMPGKRSIEQQFTTHFSMGSAHKNKPKAAEVLDCLISDSEAIGQDFEEWADNLGYDVDSRRAESIYKACKTIGQKLKAFLGADLMQVLSDCERL